MHYRSPLSKALSLGSAKSGTGHWWLQRVTAAALVPLSYWLLKLLSLAMTGSYDELLSWFAAPLNAVFLIVWFAAVCWHATMGLQVVIEDYVSSEGIKITAVWFCHLLFIVIAVSALIAVLKISLVA